MQTTTQFYPCSLHAIDSMLHVSLHFINDDERKINSSMNATVFNEAIIWLAS